MAKIKGAAAKSVDFTTVRRLGLTLPGTVEGTTYGTPALKVNGKMFACVTSHRSAEPNTLAVRMDFEHRDALIAEDPATYYLKDHYLNYPVVLVRLSKVSEDELSDLLQGAWRLVKRLAKKSPRAGTSGSPG